MKRRIVLVIVIIMMILDIYITLTHWELEQNPLVKAMNPNSWAWFRIFTISLMIGVEFIVTKLDIDILNKAWYCALVLTLVWGIVVMSSWLMI